MKETHGKDARLRCRIMGGELVVSIGITTLAHAFVHSPVGDRLCYVEETGDWDDARLRVTDPALFAIEVVHALTDEKEDGSSPLTNLFDAAYEAVTENGGLGFWTVGLDDDEPDSADAVKRLPAVPPREPGASK